MGRKVHPTGFRLGINKTWEGRWYAEGEDYINNLHQDFELRKMVQQDAPRAGVSRVDIERFPGKVKIIEKEVEKQYPYDLSQEPPGSSHHSLCSIECCFNCRSFDKCQPFFFNSRERILQKRYFSQVIDCGIDHFS